ncbi:MAG: hypothetical protein HYS27_18740 [Deltaproteobacteria bacterium]|nr:hypothetical protein [Deltaproteobacteria bacterium]
MATAREKLYEEIVAMSAAPPGPHADAEMRKLMTRYRVQTKPGIDIPAGATARDALGDRLLALWRAGGADLHNKLGLAIDEFRMQLKGAGASSSPPRPANRPSRPPVPAVDDDDPPDPPPTPARAPEKRPVPALAAPDPPPRLNHGRGGAEPVAGGPRKRGRTRGECPKCHSMGVVLARSYAGDEYFSCIYCGWQAFKPTDEDDPNASLAVRLLGQTLTNGPPRE